MNPETERLLHNELRLRRYLRMPGLFLAGVFVVLAGLIVAAGLFRVVTAIFGVE